MKSIIKSHHLAVIIFVLIFALFFSGCKPIVKTPTRENSMEQISSWSYPDFADDMTYEGLEHSILQSLSYLGKIPADRRFIFGKDVYKTPHMIKSLEHFLAYIQTGPSRRDLIKFIEANYQIYKSIGRNGKGEVLYTGYYEPLIKGSLIRSEEYKFPIYARPRDLVTIDLSLFHQKYAGKKIIGRYTGQTVVPYYDRSEIDTDGVLEDKADVLAWAMDPVDVFFSSNTGIRQGSTGQW